MGILMKLLDLGPDLNGSPIFPSCYFKEPQLRRGKLSSDSWDLCYSLFGVAADGHNIEPEYSQPVEDFYISIAWYFLNNRRGLCVLGLVKSTESGSLLTWVHD